MPEMPGKLSRRSVLRNAAVMVGVAGPAALVGSCAAPQPEPPPPAPPPAPVAQPVPVPAPPPKVPKAQAAYQDFPRGAQRCAVCANFVPPNDCRVVQGPISPNGWSRYFVPLTPGPERG
jgi:hypothetical protein